MKLFKWMTPIAFTSILSLTPNAHSAVRLDQVGYLPDAPKLALVEGATRDSFRVLDRSTGLPLYSGKLGPRRKDPDSGRITRQADFSALTQPGTYVLETTGGGVSDPFRVGADAYRYATFLSMRSYYGQRCGIRVDLGPKFPGYTHDACHLKDGFFHPSSGRKGFKKAVGGWHDAGDFGKYVVNSGITTGTLLVAWEFYGDRLKGLSLEIPESGGKIPDFLAEIKWNLDWMLEMQDQDGGVWHKLTSETFCPFIPPETDHDKRYFIGTGSAPFKSSAATADFAAVMAAASRIYRPYDRAFADKCLRAAERTWNWLDLYPNVNFSNPPNVRTGGYGDRDCSDERLWAAAELWRATGGENYARLVKNQVAQRGPGLFDAENPFGWSQVAALGYWSYAFSGRSDADPGTVSAIRKATLEAAEKIADRTSKSPALQSLTTHNFIWGSNSVALNYSVMLLMADRMEPREEFRDAALENLHYVLGRNPFGVSWVTGLGSHPFMHPHHRPSNGLTAPWPGLLSGGPNVGKQDPVLRPLPADTPPALCWVDAQGSYAGNEVAINWNAPLVFVLASTLETLKP